MCPRVLSDLLLSVCVCATDVWSISSVQVTTFTFLSADVGKTIDLVACWRLTFTDCNQTYFSCQFWPHSLYSWWFWWFSQLFQWFLRLKRTIHTIWSGWARELELENFSVKIPSKPRNKTRMKQNKQQQLYPSLRSSISNESGTGEKKSFSTAALSKQKKRRKKEEEKKRKKRRKKRSGSYLVVSTHTSGPVHLRRGRGGRGWAHC